MGKEKSPIELYKENNDFDYRDIIRKYTKKYCLDCEGAGMCGYDEIMVCSIIRNIEDYNGLSRKV